MPSAVRAVRAPWTEDAQDWPLSEDVSMDEPSSSTTPLQHNESLVDSLREGRARTGSALAEQRQRIDRLEEALVDHIQQLTKELADGEDHEKAWEKADKAHAYL